MKAIHILHLTFPAIIATAVVLLAGCDTPATSSFDRLASNPPPGGTTISVIPGENVPLQPDQDIQGVWLDSEFFFSGYNALYVEPTQFAAEVRDNEAHDRETAIGEVQNAIVAAARASGVFPVVATGSPTGTGKELRLSNTIIRFGKSQIRVRGQVYDGSKLVAVYEVERAGNDTGNITALANAIGGFFKRGAAR